jgi:hypothetical protein
MAEEQPQVNIFAVKQAQDGDWLVLLPGGHSVITGFAERSDAHDWLQDYLINWTRMHAEHEADVALRIRKQDQELRLYRAAVLAHEGKPS